MKFNELVNYLSESKLTEDFENFKSVIFPEDIYNYFENLGFEVHSNFAEYDFDKRSDRDVESLIVRISESDKTPGKYELEIVRKFDKKSVPIGEMDFDKKNLERLLKLLEEEFVIKEKTNKYISSILKYT